MRPQSSLALQSRLSTQSIRHTRSYLLPAGTYPNADPRSIYDSRVQYLWKPDSSSNVDERARITLQATAQATFGSSDLKEECLKLFFVPYWLIRIALYSPLVHATTKRQYTEGRIAMDITFSFSGSSHTALQNLHFLTPTTRGLELQASSIPPQDKCIYVPFSQAPPLHWRPFFQTMSEDKHMMLSRNLRLKSQQLQCKIAARPLLEPVVLGEYTHQSQRLTAAYCPRVGERDVKIFRRGNWTHEADPIGPLRASMNIAWSTEDPLGQDGERYRGLEESLQSKARNWLMAARGGRTSTLLTPSIWSSAAIGEEGFESVRAWQKAKVHLYNEGYEL